MNSREILSNEYIILIKFYGMLNFVSEDVSNPYENIYQYDLNGELVEMVQQFVRETTITKFRSWELYQPNNNRNKFIVKCPDLAEFERDLVYFKLL